MDNFVFNPANGLNDHINGSIDDSVDPRGDIQKLLNQIKDYINEQVATTINTHLTDYASKLIAYITDGTVTLDFGTIAAHSQTTLVGATVNILNVWNQHVIARVANNAILPGGLILEAYIRPNQDHQIDFRISNITAAPIVVGSLMLYYQVISHYI